MLAINVSIPNLKIVRLVQFWRWQFDVWTTNMKLTLGLLNRNTGCQCCSVRCSSMLKLLCISILIPNFSLDFQNFNFQQSERSRGWNCITMPNFVEIARTAAEICEFQYYASLAWKCLFTPLFEFFGAHFPQMMSLIVLTFKRTILGLNHVTW